ncbi:hypothetical protein V8F06_013974, partial [Rhypophila decipiens]
VLFSDLKNGTAKDKAGYVKIQFCGDQAERDGLNFFWVDTCCINKSDAAELQDALNSMFEWYRSAAKCYVYLSDVSACKGDADGKPSGELTFRKSRWFTRGWTLQELVAPATIEFFSRDNKLLGDKQSLEQEIHDITQIPFNALRGSPLSDFSVVERMSWIKGRETKHKEDKAYSLFGIFGVHIPVIYGEGEDRAFDRLREKIDKDSDRLARLWSTGSRDPRIDKERIEMAKGGLLADAYRWILDNPNFKRWRHLSESHLLWIKGDPGKGKTMLVCGIINELERPITADGGNLVYFFCQATDSRINNATAVLRGLIYLLAKRQPRLLSHLPENSYASDDAMAWIVLSKVLEEMLRDPNLKATYLMIDALDECVTDLPKLLDFIIRISSGRCKWLLSSRHQLDIQKKLKCDDRRMRLSLELKENAEHVSRAVDTYIDDKLSILDSLQDDSMLRKEVGKILHHKANGTFLWVALVVRELSTVESWHLLDVVNEMPPGLDEIYHRMLDNIKQCGRDSQFCRQILSTTTIAHRPLHMCEIVVLTGFPEQITKSIENIGKIVAKCGSFLTVRDNHVYLIHQSAKDFLLGTAFDTISNRASQKPLEWVFPRGIEEVNHTIFERSLCIMSSVLKRDMYGLSASGFPIYEVQPPDPDPLATVGYSCVYWVDHLYDSVSFTKAIPDNFLQDIIAVYSFLETKYLYWLEALSLLHAMSDGIIAIRRLEGLIGHTDSGQLTTLVRDAYRFAVYFRVAIEQAPLQAYISGLIFAPAKSLVKMNSKKEEPKWIKITPGVVADWNACLQTFEGHKDWVESVAFSPDGQRVVSGSGDGTVKIWDAASGSCLQTFEGHKDWVESVAFSPDGQRMVSGSHDGTVKIWDAASGSCLQTFEGHKHWVQSVAFSPDGQRVVSGSHDGTVKIWDAASGSCLQTFEGHKHWVQSVAFSPDGQHVPSDSRDQWDTVLGSSWITCNGQNMLWLPHEYRSTCRAVLGQKTLIGCSSGRIFIITFSQDK